jgi:hypothetical protein
MIVEVSVRKAGEILCRGAFAVTSEREIMNHLGQVFASFHDHGAPAFSLLDSDVCLTFEKDPHLAERTPTQETPR